MIALSAALFVALVHAQSCSVQFTDGRSSSGTCAATCPILRTANAACPSGQFCCTNDAPCSFGGICIDEVICQRDASRVAVASTPGVVSGCGPYPVAIKCCMARTAPPTPVPPTPVATTTTLPIITQTPLPRPPVTPEPPTPPPVVATPQPPVVVATPQPPPATPQPLAATPAPVTARPDCANGGVTCTRGQKCVVLSGFNVCQADAVPPQDCATLGCAPGFACQSGSAGKVCVQQAPPPMETTSASFFAPTTTGALPAWLTTPVLAGIVGGGVCFLLLCGGFTIAFCCMCAAKKPTSSERDFYRHDSGQAIDMTEGVVAGTMATWPGAASSSGGGTMESLGQYNAGGAKLYSAVMADDQVPGYAGETGFIPGAQPNQPGYSTDAEKPRF
jgi:hypothetical protein